MIPRQRAPSTADGPTTSLIAGIDDASTDVSALRNSIFATLTIYQEVVDGAGTRIVTTLDDLASTANRDAWGTAIGVAVVLTLALGLALLVAASLIRPLRRLRNDTLRPPKSAYRTRSQTSRTGPTSRRSASSRSASPPGRRSVKSRALSTT